MSPPPVIIARRPRQRGEDWSKARSWIGGLPRLGDQPWPRGADGVPLAFLAQIDLGELAEACKQSPLPQDGALAFFSGSLARWRDAGSAPRVIGVEGRPNADTPLAPDAPTVRRIDEYSLEKPMGSERERHVFAKWGIEFVPLDLPAELRRYRDECLREQIFKEVVQKTAEAFPNCSQVFRLPKRRMPWFGGKLALAQIGEAITSRSNTISWCDREIARYQALIDLPLGERSKYIDRDGLKQEIEGKRRYRQSTIALLKGLPVVADKLKSWIGERGDWEPMDDADIDHLESVLKTIRRDFGILSEIADIDRLAYACGIEMAGGSTEAFAALSDDEIRKINQLCRLTFHGPHQMFGISREIQSDVSDNCDKVMLLQLAWDDMMDWQFGDCGIFRYWITPEDLAERRWDRVTHTFEGG